MHGLFGSKRNWNTISKALATRTDTNVYALDLRNHGDAAIAPGMDYDAMAYDVHSWAAENRLDRYVLMGHSMGGRLAMHMALSKQYEQHVHRLIVVDVAPCKMQISSEFGQYVQAMKRVNAVQGCASRSQVDAMLQQDVPDVTVRQFLMTNLIAVHNEQLGQQRYMFKPPLDEIDKALPLLGEFPATHNGTTYNQPSLFIAGTDSPYVPASAHAAIHRLFPRAEIVGLQAGHWVHAEKPHEFIDETSRFLLQQG